MKKTFSIIGTFILVMALCTINSYAGTFSSAGNGGKTYATELFGTGSDTKNLPKTGTGRAVYTMNTTPSEGNPFIIDYNLSGNATWADTLTSTSLVYSGAGTTSLSLVDGGADSTNWVQYRVDVSDSGAAGDTFTLYYGIDNASALSSAGTVTLSIDLEDTLGNVDTEETLNAATSAEGTTVSLAASNTDTDLFIDVSQESKVFTGTSTSSSDFVSSTEVIIGSLTINEGSVYEQNAVSDWNFGGSGDGQASGTLALSGTFTAVSNCYLELGTNRSYDSGTDIAGTVSSDKTSIDFSLANAQLESLADNGTTNIHLVVDGSTIIDTEDISASFSATYTGTAMNDESASGSLRELTKNGTIVYPNMVFGSGAAGSGTTYDGGFRITNRDNSEAGVYFQCQNYNGSMLSQVTWSGSPLAAGATTYISTDTFLDECGLNSSASANGIITVEASNVDIYFLSWKNTDGINIVPLTVTNNQ